MQDDDVASLDDIEMVELQLVPSVVDSDGETCGTVRQEVSLRPSGRQGIVGEEEP